MINYFIVGMAAGAVFFPGSWIGAAVTGLFSVALVYHRQRKNYDRG